ncbi:ABC transporter permease [Desmospora activa]|uniref:Putative ABC transport system permease protein n=1 Tax=Desmospora activa DSM 45169 TaxID=1121389 RepID=A0A2T4Z1X1_9BACL|nr:ABC transporter permease [Desmospora activa]PTM54748.1 putative ABC transport system permease protein [Desmospora activa DSM 45169]
MNGWENLKMALDSIRAHKMRSLLTMLGIVIGVASVLVIVAIGQGGTEQLTESFAGTGNSITIMPSQEIQIENNGVTPPHFFTQRDLRDLEQIPDVEQVMVASYQVMDTAYREESVDGAFVYGVNNTGYMEMAGQGVIQGRQFQATDFRRGNGGAVLSQSLYEKLFPDGEGVGEIIRVQNQPVQVIGVLEPPTGLLGSFAQDEVYLPFATWRNVTGKNEINQLTVKTSSAETIQEVGEEAVAVLNRNHGTEGDYEVMNLDQLVQGINQVANIMTVVIGSIGGISLLVGGIGVMNIMLVSVTERTREIGIRMSLGATRGQILKQFLIESVALSVIGGLIGILIGYGAALLISLLSPLPAVISPVVAVGAVAFSILFGVIFGLLPANKASRLNPIECLRYE